jgi:2-phospho-L-lactate guanylyltransferase
MRLWAIVPVKTLQRGKSRLSGVMSKEERRLLIQTLLSRTLKTLSAIPEVAHTLVVSSDPEALAQARGLGARTLLEEGTPELNLALERAVVVARLYTAECVLVLPADLPLLRPEDIYSLLALADPAPAVVIAPDGQEDGTNALMVNPIGLMAYSYGLDSFEKHCAAALAAGARLEILRTPTLALDLDRPEDLEHLRELEQEGQDK